MWRLSFLAALTACGSLRGDTVEEAFASYEAVTGMFTTQSVSRYPAAAAGGGGDWTAGAPSVAANVILTREDDRAYWTRISDHCSLALNLPGFDSVEGISPIRLRSGAQELTALWNGQRYDISGLVAAPAYLESGDTLEVSHLGSGPGPTATVAAPDAIGADVNQYLGIPSDLATVFAGPEGGFDTFYNLVELDDGQPGFDAVSCSIPHDQGIADGGFRRHPLLDADAIEHVRQEGYGLGSFGFAMYTNLLVTDEFFPEPIAVRAGHMVQFAPGDLAP